ARPRELYPVPVDLRALIGNVLDVLKAQADNAQVRLERLLDAAAATAGDPDRLQQAIMNLSLNAIQATPPGGMVRVEAYADEGEVQTAMEDGGPEIPDPPRQRVFEPFFTTKPGGSGLGLPLVHSVVQLHGGSLAIEVGAAGGARFVIRLPQSRSPAPPP